MANNANNFFYSVVIPLYNKGPHIQRCINSVLNQTYQNFEIIVVDDGSTDDSVQRLMEIKDERISLYKKVNGGASSARNYGIERANGVYVAFLDADDEWLDNHLQTVYELHFKHPDAASIGTASQVMLQGVVVKTKKLDEREEGGLVEDYSKEFLKMMPLSNSSGTVIKKEVLQKIGGFPIEQRFYEDFNVWLKSAMCGEALYSSKVTVSIHDDAVNRSHEDFSIEKLFSSVLYLEKDLKKFSAENDVMNLNVDDILKKIGIVVLKRAIIAGDWKVVNAFKRSELFKYLNILDSLLYTSKFNVLTRKLYFFKKKIIG